jgi:hypothetical protein
VLGGKASFKEGAEGVATVATAVGAAGLDVAMMSGNRDAAGLGMVGMFAGLVAQGMAESTQAQADIREWEQLPSTVWLGTAPAKSPANKLAVALDTGAAQTATRIVDAPRCQLYWGRSIAPASLAGDAGPVEAGEHPRDPVFRSELKGMFGG